jgi:hypothetical protein
MVSADPPWRCHRRAGEQLLLGLRATGKAECEIVRCLKRYVAREIYQILFTGHTRALTPAHEPAPTAV